MAGKHVSSTETTKPPLEDGEGGGREGGSFNGGENSTKKPQKDVLRSLGKRGECFESGSVGTQKKKGGGIVRIWRG